MTIYVGGYDDAKRLSREINLRFGKDIAEPPVYTDQAGSETMFNRVVSGRFFICRDCLRFSIRTARQQASARPVTAVSATPKANRLFSRWR